MRKINKIKDLKVEDRFVVVDKVMGNISNTNWSSEMFQCFGKILKIKSINDDYIISYEDIWCWNDYMINWEETEKINNIYEENKLRFKKEDLQLFDVVKFRNMGLFLVSKYEDKIIFSGINESTWNPLENYDEFLLSTNKNTKTEPVKIYRPKKGHCLSQLISKNSLEGYDLIWQEKEIVRMTMRKALEIVSKSKNIDIDTIIIED